MNEFDRFCTLLIYLRWFSQQSWMEGVLWDGGCDRKARQPTLANRKGKKPGYGREKNSGFRVFNPHFLRKSRGYFQWLLRPI